MPFDLCRSLIENVSRVIVGKGPTIGCWWRRSSPRGTC